MQSLTVRICCCDAAYMCIRESRACCPQGQGSLARAGKEACDLEGSSLRRSTITHLALYSPLLNRQELHFPMGEFVEVGHHRERCIGFSSTAVRSTCYIVLLISYCKTRWKQLHHLPNSVAAILHAASSCPGMWTLKTSLPAQCNALGHSPITYVPPYSPQLSPSPTPFLRRRCQHCSLIRL
jgi:hypothetical protein